MYSGHSLQYLVLVSYFIHDAPETPETEPLSSLHCRRLGYYVTRVLTAIIPGWYLPI